MDNLGDELRTDVYEGAARCWDIAPMNGIGGTILEQEAQEGFDAVEQGTDDKEVDCNEDDCASSHSEGREVVSGSGRS